MDKNYWHAKWNAHDTAFDQKEPNEFLTKFIGNLALKSGDKILVPLAGKSVDMLWLRDQDFHVVGVELNESACRRFFSTYRLSFRMHEHGGFQVFEGDKLQLWCGDFFALRAEFLGTIDAVYDRAALVALPERMRARYAEQLKTLASDQTQILLLTAIYDQTTMLGPPFSVDEKELARLFTPRFELEILYDRPVVKIPAHLHAKGLKDCQERVYRLYS